MPNTRTTGALRVELLATGPNAHGYGRVADGRTFAFRVRNRKARMEIYRADADGAEPMPEDVELVAELSTGRVNLHSDRSLKVLLRTLVAAAEPGHEAPERTLRGYLGRLDAMLDGWAEALAG
ncbi:MAG TPA: hypothetical protein VGJ95_17420 [Pseudonocardiaceae bacterium]|jgi:hypothetical protein